MIVSLYSANKGLFYAIESVNSEKFCEIVDNKPEELYQKPEDIKFGDVFIYLDKTNSYLRAFRLNSFPANKSAIRSFLIDTGVEVFENFTHGRYFKLPEKFNYTDALAIFCNLETFPASDDVELKSEFLEKNMFRRMKFNVKRQIKLQNALGSSNLCVVVDIEDIEEVDEVCEIPNEFTWNTRPESPPKEEKTFLPELSFMDGSCDEHVPFPASFVLQNTDLPEPGEILTIYCTEVLSPSTLFACYNKKENFTNDYFPESLSVELLMNDDDVVESYENLLGEPTVGEMVITIGRDSRYHRGLVKAIAGNFYLVSPMKMILDSNLTMIYRFSLSTLVTRCTLNSNRSSSFHVNVLRFHFKLFTSPSKE